MTNPAAELVRIRWGPRCTEEEAALIVAELVKIHGDIRQAAKAEGVSRGTLYSWRRGIATPPIRYRELLSKSKA